MGKRFVLVISVVVVLTVFTLLGVFVFWGIGSGDTFSRNHVKYIQHTRYSRDGDETSKNIVISKGDFHSFSSSFSDDGSFHTITPFESSRRFKCLGKCVCEGEEDKFRRNLVVAPLSIAISAVSTIMAMAIAKEYFSGICHYKWAFRREKKFADKHCDDDLEVCEEEFDDTDWIDAEDILSETTDEEQLKQNVEVKERMKGVYQCSGYCIEKNYGFEIDPTMYKNPKRGSHYYHHCHEHTLKDVPIEFFNEANDIIIPNNVDKELGMELYVLDGVKEKFVKFHLNSFCKKESTIKKEVKDKRGKVIRTYDWANCLGSRHDLLEPYNVECEKT